MTTDANPAPRNPPLGIPRSVTRVDDDGTSIEVSYIDVPDGPTLFGVTHAPANLNGHGVVICSPINNDQLKNNRREVLLSGRLAAAGFAVQRFHYAGTGSSEGSSTALTVDSMASDTSHIADYLVSRTGVEVVSFMGTRLGALPAAAVAAERSAALALWEPMEGATYFRELFRGAAIAEMSSDGGGATLADLKARFNAEGSMDVTGFAVHKSLYESRERPLAALYGSGDAAVFLAQFRNKPELRRDLAALVEDWKADGRAVTWENVLFEEAWMFFVFGFRAEEDREHSQGLIEATARWFEGLL